MKSLGRQHAVPPSQTANLHNYPDPASLARAAAADWLSHLEAANAGNTGGLPIPTALSGGRITRDFFAEIVRQYRAKPDNSLFKGLFDNVHFFWADERCVPPDDPESNFGMARELLLAPLKIPPARIHRLRGEGPEELALQEALADIGRMPSAATSKGYPVLDVAFLGMGENGHTASLFPAESEATMNDPAIYRFVTADKPPPRRMTMGYGVLAAAREIRVLISGRGKEAAMRELWSPSGKTPLARLIGMGAKTTIYTDVG
jgi:6-phosphogluconolactonase